MIIGSCVLTHPNQDLPATDCCTIVILERSEEPASSRSVHSNKTTCSLKFKNETRNLPHFRAINGTAATAAAIPASFTRVKRSFRKHTASSTVMTGYSEHNTTEASSLPV